jgi:hypothetical protein
MCQHKQKESWLNSYTIEEALDFLNDSRTTRCHDAAAATATTTVLVVVTPWKSR